MQAYDTNVVLQQLLFNYNSTLLVYVMNTRWQHKIALAQMSYVSSFIIITLSTHTHIKHKYI